MKLIKIRGQLKTAVITYPEEEMEINLEQLAILSNNGFFVGGYRIILAEGEREKIEKELGLKSTSQANKDRTAKARETMRKKREEAKKLGDIVKPVDEAKLTNSKPGVAKLV